MNAPALQIDGIIIPVTPHPEHEYTLTTAEVAAGYGVSKDTLKKTFRRHSDEMAEGKHWFSEVGTNCPHPGNNEHGIRHWTKRGIIRLGFFIKSERAKRFRDMAEDLCLREWDRPAIANDHSSLVAAIAALTVEVRDLRLQIAATPSAPVTTGDAVASLPSSSPDPLADWIGRLALDLLAARETSRRYTVRQLLSLDPPGTSGHLGRRLATLVGNPVPTGPAGYTATCRPVRTARARYWEIRLQPPLWSRCIRRG